MFRYDFSNVDTNALNILNNMGVWDKFWAPSNIWLHIIYLFNIAFWLRTANGTRQKKKCGKFHTRVWPLPPLRTKVLKIFEFFFPKKRWKKRLKMHFKHNLFFFWKKCGKWPGPPPPQRTKGWKISNLFFLAGYSPKNHGLKWLKMA